MRQFQISKVRLIPFDKNQNPVNLVVIELVGVPTEQSVVRRYSQFLVDLRESFLIGSDVKSMTHPSVRSILRKLRGGTIEGNVTFHKKGDPYKITEDSGAITNENHPLYGKVSVGDTLKRENDGSWIDGFLTLEPDMRYLRMESDSDAYANSRLAMEGFMQGVEDVAEVTPTTETPVEEFDPTEVLKKEVVGAGEGKPE